MSSNRVRDIIFYSIEERMAHMDFYVLNADMMGRPFIDIQKRYPERFVQVGIAEQNLVAVAAGLALAGKKPVTFSPAPFIYLRAFDQIRNAVSAMNLNVVMIANGFGFVNPGLGVTHFPTESYNILSLCPNLEFITLSDEAIAGAFSEYICQSNAPIYACLDFNADGILVSEEKPDMQKGWRLIKQVPASDTVIITDGFLLRVLLQNDDIFDTNIIEVFKHPYDNPSFFSQVKKYQHIVIAEEYQAQGGWGAEICTTLALLGIDVKRLCVNYGKKFPGVFGDREYWMENYGVNISNLKKAIRK